MHSLLALRTLYLCLLSSCWTWKEDEVKLIAWGLESQKDFRLNPGSITVNPWKVTQW